MAALPRAPLTWLLLLRLQRPRLSHLPATCHTGQAFHQCRPPRPALRQPLLRSCLLALRCPSAPAPRRARKGARKRPVPALLGGRRPMRRVMGRALLAARRRTSRRFLPRAAAPGRARVLLQLRAATVFLQPSAVPLRLPQARRGHSRSLPTRRTSPRQQTMRSPRPQRSEARGRVAKPARLTLQLQLLEHARTLLRGLLLRSLRIIGLCGLAACSAARTRATRQLSNVWQSGGEQWAFVPCVLGPGTLGPCRRSEGWSCFPVSCIRGLLVTSSSLASDSGARAGARVS